jgi:hypothetical protein
VGVVEIVFALVYAVTGAALARAVWRHGLIGTFEALKGGMRRVVEGPMPRKGDPWAPTYPPGIEVLIGDLDGPVLDLVLAVEQWVEGGESDSRFQVRTCARGGHTLPQGRSRCDECEVCPDCGRPVHDNPCPPPARTPVVEQAPAWPTEAAPPAIAPDPDIMEGADRDTFLDLINGRGETARRIRHRGEASNVVPIVADWLGGEAADLPTTREQFDLLGGPHSGRTVTVLNRPRVIVLEGVRYEAVTDPDTGAFLGGYAIRGWDVPCEVCNQHPHRPRGSALEPRDHAYRPSSEYLLRLRGGDEQNLRSLL